MGDAEAEAMEEMERAALATLGICTTPMRYARTEHEHARGPQ
jgi:hypothetical protein